MTSPTPPRSLQEIAVQLESMRLLEEPGEILGSLLATARDLLRARRLVLLFYDVESEQLFRWESGAGEPRPTRVEVPPPEVSAWITLDRAEATESLDASSPLGRRLEAQKILSARFPSDGNCIRLLAVDPQNASPANLEGLLRLGLALAPLVERFYLLQRVRAMAIDEERNRIAQDFHDGPLQAFLGVEVQLQYIRQLIDRDPQGAAKEIEQIRQLVRTQAREIRELLQEMRPVDVGRASLMVLLRQLADEVAKGRGIQVQLYSVGHRVEVPRSISREVYQIVREAVSNARKHGNATHVVIGVDSEPDVLEITVDDDGTGYQFSGSYTLEEMDRLRIGPVSIKQRVRHLGASLHLESTPGHGSSLMIRIPLKS